MEWIKEVLSWVALWPVLAGVGTVILGYVQKLPLAVIWVLCLIAVLVALAIKALWLHLKTDRTTRVVWGELSWPVIERGRWTTNPKIDTGFPDCPKCFSRLVWTSDGIPSRPTVAKCPNKSCKVSFSFAETYDEISVNAHSDILGMNNRRTLKW